MADLRIYRRRLPHWRLQGATYFVTWRVRADTEGLNPEERSCVVEAVRHFADNRYELFAYVVMDDHVHVLVRPIGAHRLEEIVHSWKSFSSHRISEKRSSHSGIWQDEYFDRVMRNNEELREKANYILNNPWNRWRDLEHYIWVGYQED